MGTPGTALINGQWAFVDSDDPGTALGYLSAAGQGGGVLFHVSEFLVLNGTLLSTITNAGSGVIISAAERAGLHGHSNLTTLNQLTAPTAGQVGYIRTATAAGVEGWMQAPVTSVNDQGWWANLAALKIGIPTGQAGWYATLINSGSPATVAVWDADLGPADWVEIGNASVTSVDPGSGAQSGAVVFDSDDVDEGVVNLFLTAGERTDIATIDALATTVSSNTTLATHTNIAALNSISSAGSGVIISAAERSALDVIRDPLVGATGWLLVATGEGLDQFAWTEVAAGGVGTVTSVNSVSPITGNVTIDMDDMSEGTNKILTQAERTSIANSANVTASNATAIARLKGQQALTFTTALAFNASSYLNATVTLTAQTKPALLTGVAAGETAKLTLIQDSTGGHHVDWSNFEGNPKISKSHGSKTTVEIYIESPTIQRVGVVSQSGNYMARTITHPNATFNGIGGGALAIYDRVVTDAVWTWDDVRKYEYCLLQDLQWYMPNSSLAEHDKVATVKANAPNTKILAMTRFDLWWMFDESGAPPAELAAYEWGGSVHSTKPTFAMGEVPLAAADSWATAQANLLSAGYTQTARHSTMTSAGTLLSLPYQILLDSVANEWNCRNNVMKVNDDDWLELYSDHIVALRAFEPNCDGYHINVEKLQLYQAAGPKIGATQLWGWMQAVSPYDNPGWVLATNSSGTNPGFPSWGAGGVDGTVLDTYSDRNAVSSMIDIYEGAEKLALMLRRKDPTAFIYFSPFNFTVNGHLNSAYLDDFQVAYIAREGGTTADSDVYQAALITRMASVCDAIEFPANDTGAFSADWAAQIRATGKVSKWTITPQDISLLSNQ